MAAILKIIIRSHFQDVYVIGFLNPGSTSEGDIHMVLSLNKDQQVSTDRSQWEKTQRLFKSLTILINSAPILISLCIITATSLLAVKTVTKLSFLHIVPNITISLRNLVCLKIAHL